MISLSLSLSVSSVDAIGALISCRNNGVDISVDLSRVGARLGA